MKCKFTETISYGSQTFFKGKTYDLSQRDAVALGFAKAKTPTSTAKPQNSPPKENKTPKNEAGESEAPTTDSPLTPPTPPSGT